MTAHSITILSQLKMTSFWPVRWREEALSINCASINYQLHFVAGRAKCPTVPQRRENVTGIAYIRATGQGSK